MLPAAILSCPATDRRTMSVWAPTQPRKLYRIMDNLEHILAIELMNAAQGIDFRRPQKTSPFLEGFLREYRKGGSFCERRHCDVQGNS